MDPPEIDSFFFHPTFWHRHLIHGTNLASPSFFDASLVDTLAGNQLCQWSTVGAAEGRSTNQKDALLLASHLIIHLPPRVGAYVLASPTWPKSPLTPQDRKTTHAPNLQQAIEAVREQAILGRVPAHLIPALASPNTDIINRKITWTLRFSFAGPGRRRSAKSSLRGPRTSRLRPPQRSGASQRTSTSHHPSPTSHTKARRSALRCYHSMASRGSYSRLITPLPGRLHSSLLPGSTILVFQRQTQPPSMRPAHRPT